MESINFSDFSEKERHDIITAFLKKAREADSMDSAHNFCQYYLKQFYKIPNDLLEDIIYCQRAIKNHLIVHQKIKTVFAEQPDADPQDKNEYLLEIEDILHQINAESQYLMVRLEEDIERFCLPFTEQHLQPDQNFINEMVAETIVPLLCGDNKMPPKPPHSVIERPTKIQLLKKYFTINTDIKSSLASKAEDAKLSESSPSKKKPIVNTDAAVPEAIAKPATKPAAPTSEVASKINAVNVSRLHLHAALKRARLSQQVNSETKAPSAKESFLRAFGLCSLQTQALNQERTRKLPKNSSENEPTQNIVDVVPKG